MNQGKAALVAVQTVTYHGWKDALRLTNGTVEVVVVPSLGRVMHYGFVGGTNLIWEDPALAGKPVDAKTFPRFGGNKAWPSPQEEWPLYIGHEWPPPPEADQTVFKVSFKGRGAVILESIPLVGFGVAIVREIHLAPKGTRVTLTTRLEYTGPAPAKKPLGAWSITPVAAPDTLLARLSSRSPLTDGYKALGAFDPFASVTAKNGVLHIARNKDKSSKIGIDGETLGAVYGDTLWLLRNRTPQTAGQSVPGERLQVYANADSREDAARGLPPYMELEMTSPRKALSRPGDSVSLTEVWELQKLTGSEAVRHTQVENSLRYIGSPSPEYPGREDWWTTTLADAVGLVGCCGSISR